MTEPVHTETPLPTDPPSDPPRRRLGRRTIALIAGGAALVIAGATIGGVLLAQHLAHQNALTRYESARADAEAAHTAATDAEDAATAAVDDLGAALTAADAAIAITGAGIGADDTASFASARTEAEGALSTGPLVIPGVTAMVLRGTTTDEIDAEADAVQARAAELRDHADDAQDRATAATEATDALTSAAADYAKAVAETGTSVLTDRADAAEGMSAGLQAQIDALSAVDLADLAPALTAYRAAVDAAIASSEEARRPVTEPGGSGVRVSDPASLTAVVNKRRGLPAGYVPPGLTTPSFIPGASQVRGELVEPLRRMQADMAAAGITLRMSSGYRSFDRQATIYNGFVAREGVAGADTHSARPGNSEHQTGLSVDLDDGTGCNLSRCFADTPGGRWLAENAWRYGFILRYGDGWTPVVGYTFEPWHYRFVGESVAADMHGKGITTLEQYLGLPAAPDYG